MNKADHEILGLFCAIAAVAAIIALTSCSSQEPKARIMSYPVACDPCQKFNKDLAAQPEAVDLCVCE